MSYYYEFDYDSKYCYDNSHVLRNKLNIKDEGKLASAEREITAIRGAQILAEGIEGVFDYAAYKGLHKKLFGEIFDWAGVIRHVNIAKGNKFCLYEYIDEHMFNLFEELKNENYLRDLKDEKLIGKRLAYYLGEINAIHPFREGNGRTQRLFIELLANDVGYYVDFDLIYNQRMLIASAQSFYGDYREMEGLIIHAMRKIE
ncbi:MAG TPA: Fic family protein [Anaerovoracaceae bacterium]|nr:Fic family protein [Anaerovoracaceae bacterium]